VRTYAPGDVDGLLAAIEASRASEPDRAGAQALATRSTWSAAFADEMAGFQRLMGRTS
jgi:hypothetical protein